MGRADLTGRDGRRWKRSAGLVVAALLALLVGAPAQAAKTGGGVASGTMAFTPGIAPLGPTCQASTVPEFELASEAFLLDTQIVGYAGPLTITMSGATFCETFSAGSGTLTGSIRGDNTLNGSTIRCTSLQGGFTRVLTDIRIRLAGPCTINQFGTSNIGFLGELTFVPNGLEQGRPAGILQPVTSAQLRGAFVVTPG